MVIKKNNALEQDRIRWVILLLAGAVILPTVCLLWFMSQAVKNERFAVKEKLVRVYEKSLKSSLDQTIEFNRITTFLALAFSADGFLIFDSNDNFIFPVEDVSENIISDEVFNKAYKLEYANENPADAIEEYDSIFETLTDDALKIKARIASARCFKKVNQSNKAIEILREVINKYNDNNSQIHTQKLWAWLLLVELLRQDNYDNFIEDLSAMYDYAADNIDTDEDLVLMGLNDYTGKYIPTSLQVLVIEKFLEYTENFRTDSIIAKKIRRANQMLPILKMSLEMSNIFDSSYIKNTDFHQKKVYRLDTHEQLYAHYTQAGSRKYLKIYHRPTIEYWFKYYIEDMNSLPSQCVIYDEKGNIVAGEIIHGKEPFIRTELNSDYFRGWTTEIYIHSSAFDNAADKQAAVYIWAGVLVISLIVVSGGFAGRSISRQMKMNKLKNDFIATITHELKTPLASMRVLADTLLEGHYSKRGQDALDTKEYLELICKENKRLTGLIDNFLSFSRMERNKQVFEFEKVNPADIAKSAIEAIKTKYSQKNCHFSQKIDDDLLPISVDKEAIVTVLVNLLDNACKYTYDNKEIELRIFCENENVCFSVKDNGIGMTKRQMRKIFDRFYQADTTLSRRTEGTGLGLSIVKFILDAHNATIEVKSQPEKGSMFIVKIPILP